MPPPSRTGVRGLSRRKSDGRYILNVRYREPKSGLRKRYYEEFPPKMKGAAAKLRARQIVDGLAAGTFDPDRKPEERPTMREAFDAYLEHTKATRPKTHKDKNGHAKAICAVLGTMRVAELTPFAVQRFIYSRKSVAPATVNRALNTLRHMLKFARSRGWVSLETIEDVRSVERLPEPKARVRFVRDEEWTRLADVLSERRRRYVASIIRVALLSGMRRSEMVTLRWSQVDLSRREIHLTKTKNGKDRVVKVNDALAAELEAISRRGEHVFISSRGKAYAPDSVSHMFASACKRAKVTGLRLHDLRHDFATRLRRRGVGLDVIQRVLGHSEITTTLRYAHIGDEAAAEAVAGITLPVARPLPGKVVGTISHGGEVTRAQ